MEGLGGGEVAEEDFGVLAHGEGAVAAVGGGEEGEGVVLFELVGVHVAVAGFAAGGGGGDPDLEEFGGGVGGGVELGVLDAGAGGHVLEFAGLDDAAVAQGVLVFELAGDDVGEDLHGAVGVGREAAAGGDGVVVDDAEAAIAHVVGVVVVAEGEGEAGLKPAVVGGAAFVAAADGEPGHGVSVAWKFLLSRRKNGKILPGDG